jgi:hypothetical protein
MAANVVPGGIDVAFSRGAASSDGEKHRNLAVIDQWRQRPVSSTSSPSNGIRMNARMVERT